VDSDNQTLIFHTADEGGSTPNFQLYRSTQQQMMKTPFVLNTALRKEGVSGLQELVEAPSAMEWLQKSIKVEFPDNGEIMRASVETQSGDSCVKIINAVVEAYMDEVVLNERNDRLKRLDNLERVYSEAEQKVRTKRSELRALATALGTSDSDSLTVAQENALQQFGVMQTKLSEVQFQLMQAEGELEIAKKWEEQALAEMRRPWQVLSNRRQLLTWKMKLRVHAVDWSRYNEIWVLIIPAIAAWPKKWPSTNRF
jgi:translation initiation factor IF-2